MGPVLNVEEVECVRKALEQYRNQFQGETRRDLSQLLGVFRRGQQYFSLSKKPLDDFAVTYRKLLEDALNAYCKGAPQDLDVAEKVCARLGIERK